MDWFSDLIRWVWYKIVETVFAIPSGISSLIGHLFMLTSVILECCWSMSLAAIRWNFRAAEFVWWCLHPAVMLRGIRITVRVVFDIERMPSLFYGLVILFMAAECCTMMSISTRYVKAGHDLANYSSTTFAMGLIWIAGTIFYAGYGDLFDFKTGVFPVVLFSECSAAFQHSLPKTLAEEFLYIGARSFAVLFILIYLVVLGLRRLQGRISAADPGAGRRDSRRMKTC